MATFRKKPVVIEAVRFVGITNGWGEWEGDSEIGLPDWLTDAVQTGRAVMANGVVSIDTPEGTMVARPGDWIIRGVKGELYPCKSDIFAATYEAVTHAA